jgi:alkylation response protein AidB-like acyl-CoA dehydrogenase
MASNLLVDSRDVRFVLFEFLDTPGLTEHDIYSEFDRDIFEDVLALAEQISYNRLYPANALSEKEGVFFDPATGEVRVPEAFKEPYRLFKESGFPGLWLPVQYGGMGLPTVVFRAALEYFFSASLSFTIYCTLTMGAANLVRNFCADELKDLFLQKMVEGEWGGTMCLTEPDAGSDVGALTTKAVRQDDGTYLITGQKIFITSGDNDLYENMVHPVLARIEGDPPGSRGISMFLVPKFLVNPDGSPGERNDFVCSGIEHKMGLNGSATCALSFGDNGKCTGYLMGEERKGLKMMFQMMNEARIDVGLQGLAVSSSAYLHAVTYAKNRVQGKDIMRMTDPGAPSVPIISHPDVKRMLLRMKSYVEAMRMLIATANYSVDRSITGDEAAAVEEEALVDFLTPIIKAGNTNRAWEITGEAIQVYGGYGYTTEYPVEQLARDSKILSIYEGTNGIQAMDLIMRKLLMNPELKNYTIYRERILKAVDDAAGIVDEKFINPVKEGVETMNRTVAALGEKLKKMEVPGLMSRAVHLLEAFALLSYAWMHLRSLTVATPELDKIVGEDEPDKVISENSEAAFYRGKILASRYFIGTEFGKYSGIIKALLAEDDSVIESVPEIFTGAPDE